MTRYDVIEVKATDVKKKLEHLNNEELAKMYWENGDVIKSFSTLGEAIKYTKEKCKITQEENFDINSFEIEVIESDEVGNLELVANWCYWDITE